MYDPCNLTYRDLASAGILWGGCTHHLGNGPSDDALALHARVMPAKPRFNCMEHVRYWIVSKTL